MAMQSCRAEMRRKHRINQPQRAVTAKWYMWPHRGPAYTSIDRYSAIRKPPGENHAVFSSRTDKSNRQMAATWRLWLDLA